jgi:Domain of unknown function (DUF4382)/Domain of unknown function (DUF5666)
VSRLVAFSTFFFVTILLVSCGGPGSSFPNLSTTDIPAGVPVTMSVQDSPPAGVAVLSFEIQVISASLHPSDSSKADVPLLTRPTDVELEHLQTEPALLGSLNVPAGSYSGVTVTFANPRMAIFNYSSTAIGSCAVKTACRLSPTLNNAVVTVSGPIAPFPITLAMNSPLGLLLHFDVNSSVQSDFSITPTIDLKKIVPSTTGVIHREHLVGTITDVSSPLNFALQPGLGELTPVSLPANPPTFLIKTDTNTKYSFVGEDALNSSTLCTSNSFSCLAVGQTVKVTVNVLSDGSLLATQVSLFEQRNMPAFEGTVISVDPTNNVFKMALMGGQWSPTAAPTTSAAVGVPVTVNVTPSTVYEIDKDGFTLPAGLTFDGIADMVAGQAVEIQPSAVSAGPEADRLFLTTLRVRLDETQVTAQVTSIDITSNPPTFALGNGTLPPLFSAASSINVQTITTPPPTQFQNVSGVSGLSVGDTVSVGGLLFNTGTTPTLAAEEVLKRLQCSAVATGPTTIFSCVMP